MKESRSKWNVISFWRVIVILDIYYKWPFWKLVRIGNNYELRPRSWLHLIVHVIAFPFWILSALLASIPALLEANVKDKRLTWYSPENPNKMPSKAELKQIKKRLLMN